MNGGIWSMNTIERDKKSEVTIFVWKCMGMKVTVNQSRQIQKGKKAQLFLR